MKYLKNFFIKNKLFIFVVSLTIFLGIYVCCFAFKNVLNINILAENLGELRVYTIYHVETFEGGGKSRISYIKSIANEIEKSNSGVLFLIKTIDVEKLSFELGNEVPDIISFGFGIGKTILPYLKEFDSDFSIRDELVESGSFNNKLYAIPYIVSGYAEIKKDDEISEFFCGKSDYVSPENLDLSSKVTSWFNSSYEAYKNFINTKNSAFIGTGRDVFRVQNLNSLGRLNATITPISTYTDLIQYIGVCKTSPIVNLFVESLLSRKNQMKLTEYSLFSSLNHKIYTKDIYADMEEAILKCKIPSLYA